MKVIDMLNKIANGEEVSKFIVCEDTYYLGDNGYLREQGVGETQWYIDKNWLNEEVEIIEQEKKIPEKMSEFYTKHITENGEMTEIFNKHELAIIDKINEILDYLKSKGE